MVDRTFLSKFLAALAAVALLLALPATAGGLDGVPPIAGPSQEYPEGSPGSLAAGLNLMVDAPASVATTDTPFAIDIRYANGLPEAQVVTLDYIEVQSGTRYERFDIGKAVPSVTSDLAALWRVDSDVSASPANRSTAAGDVRAHIGKVKTNATPRELMTASNETTVTVKATAHFTVDAAPVMVTSSTTVGIAAYADAPVGWLAGDGHVHSEYSDGSGTVAEDAAAAAATGLDFMVITDHADKMTARDFGTELSECDAATYETGVRTIMGQEYPINHVFLSADGHYLGYSPNYYIDPTGITHQSIIDAVNAAGGIGIIAHPNHYTMGWSEWDASGDAGLEILSDGWPSDSDAGLRERWDGLIAGRAGCAGMGSSDAHSAGDIGQERTYVYTGGSTSKTAILAGIRNGQTVVSDGIFASCDIKGRGIGEHVRASFGESLPVRVDWPTSQNLSTVTLVYNGRTVREHVHADDNAASGLVIPVTATDGGAIRIEATGTNGKHAFTSPVFVDVGVPGGAIDLAFVIDTTGSMWDDIAAAKQAATQIGASLEDVDARVAVVDYRDFPQWPYGTYWDYPYHDVLDFTSDQTAIAAGIRSLNLGNGLDWQESVYSALMHTIDGASLGGWRQQPNKYIILIGDAPRTTPSPSPGTRCRTYWMPRMRPTR
ncbi:MAG: CehA/McbA family metallohydrolase [Coriobacteriia bacterium]